jgi:molecular chaperone GrpE
MVNEENNDQEETKSGETKPSEAELKETEIKTEIKTETEARSEEYLKELQDIKKQLQEEKDRCLRLSAEFDNFRKRILKEREEFIKYSNEKLILELIDVLENLERGLENAKKAENKDKLIEGMDIIYRQFRNILEKYGLTPIKAVGEKFDPYKHEAMMQTLTDECDDGTILEEFAKGYMLNNRVIRYSKVRVSKKKEDKLEHEVN